MRTATYRFSKDTWEGLRQWTVIQLIKDGFAAWREYDRDSRNELLITTATTRQVRLAAGRGWVIHD